MRRVGRGFPARKALLSVATQPAIQFDAVGGGTSALTASLTWTHVTGSGLNRLLVVDVGVLNTLSQRVSTITYGAQSLVFLAAAINATTTRVERWFLVAPTAGSATVTVTLTATAAVSGNSTSWTGVDQQAEPFRGFTANTGTGTSISTDENSAAGDIILDTVASATTGATPGAGQTQRYSGGPTGLTNEGSSEPGAAGTVTMSWTAGISAAWAQITTSFVASTVSLSDTPLDTDASSAGADAVSSIAFSATETSSGVDAVSSIAPSSAETGAGADAGSSIASSAAETSSGAEGTPTITPTNTETGSGSEAGALALALTDTGSGSDTASLAFTDTDLGSGADTAALALSTSETTSGADTGSIAATLTHAETGVGTDTASIGLTYSDTSSSTEGTASIGLSGADSGGAGEGALPTELIYDTDAAHGVVETTSSASALSTNETGSGADTPLIASALVAPGEAGQGAEPSTVMIAPSTTESASGLDQEAFAFSSADSVSASEGSPMLALSDTETALGIDAHVVSITSAEMGVGSDDHLIGPLMTDLATAVDALAGSLAIAVVTADVLLAAEAIGTFTAALTYTESGTGAESLYRTSLVMADTGQGTEATSTIGPSSTDAVHNVSANVVQIVVFAKRLRSIPDTRATSVMT